MGSLLKSTGIVAASTLTSRIMGFLRDMLFAKYFGATGATDAFWIAFRIPNMMRRFVAEGTLTISFIPVYSDILINEGEKEALALAQKTLSILFVALIGIISIGMIFSPELAGLLAWGIDDPGILSLAGKLTRYMFPYLFFVSFVAFSMGVLNTHGYFFAPAFSPVLLNINIIVGIVLLGRFFQEPLYGVAVGVIAGGLFQLILQIPYLIKSGFKLRISLDLKHPGIRRIGRLIAPTLFGAGIYEINIIIITILSSMLPSGNITYLYYCNRLTELVIGIFIVSIGSVVLPEMSKLKSIDDMEQFKKVFRGSMNASMFLAIPASTALVIIGFPILSVLFMRGKFTPADAEVTYRALVYASIGISSVSILRIVTPAFYSLKDAKTPVIAAFINFILNFFLGYFLMGTSLKLAGLTLGLSISVTVQIIILLVILQRKIGHIQFGQIFISMLKYIAASIVMGIVIMQLSGLADWVKGSILERILILLLTIFSGGMTYFAVCYLLKVDEIKYLLGKVKGKLKLSS
ncbi:murein biosynthesis integral membrane protein MurJ [Spirochaetota bacterium]